MKPSQARHNTNISLDYVENICHAQKALIQQTHMLLNAVLFGRMKQYLSYKYRKLQSYNITYSQYSHTSAVHYINKLLLYNTHRLLIFIPYNIINIV